jgi:hypothetical protein
VRFILGWLFPWFRVKDRAVLRQDSVFSDWYMAEHDPSSDEWDVFDIRLAGCTDHMGTFLSKQDAESAMVRLDRLRVMDQIHQGFRQ